MSFSTNEHFLSALAKLRIPSQNHPSFQALPAVREAGLWNEIRTEYQLTLFELGALHNARCHPSLSLLHERFSFSSLLSHCFHEKKELMIINDLGSMLCSWLLPWDSLPTRSGSPRNSSGTVSNGSSIQQCGISSLSQQTSPSGLPYQCPPSFLLTISMESHDSSGLRRRNKIG